MTQTPSLRRLNIQYSLLHIAYWAAFASFAGYQTALLLERGFSSGDAGVFASLRCLAGIVSQPVIGGWADRHPEVSLKKILNLYLAGSLVANLLFYVVHPGFVGTAWIILLLGTLELNAYPLLDSMAVQFINAGIDVNYSLGRGMGSLAYAVSCVAVGQQAARLGVESTLITHAVLLVALMAAVAAYPAFPQQMLSDRQKTARPHSVLWILRQNPAFTLMLAASFFAMVSVLPIASFMVTIIGDRGGDDGWMGFALFLVGASEFPAAVLFRRLWRRFGSRRMMVLSITFMAVRTLLTLLAPGVFWTLAVQTVQLLGYGLFTPASVYYANENVSVADRVRGQSVMMVASNGLGGVVGNLIAGYAIDFGGVRAMLAVLTACGVIGIVLAVLAAGMTGSGKRKTV